MKRDEGLTEEVHAIRCSDHFRRSPSLKGLLGYLLQFEIAGRGSPSQMDIAFDHFGKSPANFDAADSSVRVAMSRLRKALTDYYLVHQPRSGLCVYVRKNDYRLRLANLSVAYPHLAAVRSHADRPSSASFESLKVQSPSAIVEQVPEASGIFEHQENSAYFSNHIGKKVTRSHFSKSSPRILFAGVILAIAAFFYPQEDSGAVENLLQRSGLKVPLINPHVSVTRNGREGLEEQALKLEIYEKVKTILRKSMVSRLGSEARTDYHMLVKIEVLPDDKFGGNIVLFDGENRVVAESTVNPLSGPLQLKATVQDETIAFISPAGKLVKSLSIKVPEAPRNSFECFLHAENDRIAGLAKPRYLDHCIKTFPASEFTPYLRVRRAFGFAQNTMRTRGYINEQDESWRATSEVLEAYPDNPFANAAAAKLLMGKGNCGDAVAFANDAFSRGQTYPALELAVIVDAYGCASVARYRTLWDERISYIASANSDPNPLLETYLLLGAVVSGQTAFLNERKPRSFVHGSRSKMTPLNDSLHRVIGDRATARDISYIKGQLPNLIFSRETRKLIAGKLEQSRQRRSNGHT